MKIKIKEAEGLEAVQFKRCLPGSTNEPDGIEFSEDPSEWLVLALAGGKIMKHPVWPDKRLQVTTETGPYIADENDWIVRYKEGNFSVIKADEFDENYEAC